ncbi:hypothetical protein ZIOFF_005668 [Zingiber officinale]|uniref:CCHC-type domain-containing protein n=1 Tax=Zingiber officinale TaxID=94328 RepID=A0A8J5IB52_ZINOF|nr:hypothetical protein ZIOFF_005668 [Zingiber officinale]
MPVRDAGFVWVPDGALVIVWVSGILHSSPAMFSSDLTEDCEFLQSHLRWFFFVVDRFRSQRMCWFEGGFVICGLVFKMDYGHAGITYWNVFLIANWIWLNRIHGEQIQQILQAREQGSTPRRSTPSTQPVYKQFRELGPTEFKGTTDPIAAEGWIRSLETIFDFMQLTDADKVRCAIFMLRDDARVWWEGARLIVDLTILTWANFKEVFYGKYFTVDNRTRLAREFLDLRQGDMTVAEYVRRFERGRYFVPMITSQPVEELKHFTEGLRPAIRHDVRLSRVTTFREAVDQALMSERDRNDMIKEAQNKRLSYQGRDQQEPGKKRSVPGQNPGKQSFEKAQPRQQIQKTQAAKGTVVRAENKVRCSKCEKIHAGQCLTGTDACYMCKKSGHFARECPLLKEPTRGRVFAMTQEQVDLDTAIITGMIYIANIPACVLIESGATHSFISEAYLTKLGIKPERMGAEYSVSLPSGEELHSNRMVKNCQMMMQDHMVLYSSITASSHAVNLGGAAVSAVEAEGDAGFGSRSLLRAGIFDAGFVWVPDGALVIVWVSGILHSSPAMFSSDLTEDCEFLQSHLRWFFFVVDRFRSQRMCWFEGGFVICGLVFKIDYGHAGITYWNVFLIANCFRKFQKTE